MSIKEQLNAELKEAMRNKETARRDAIRFLLSAVRNAEIDKGSELSEQETVTLFQKQAKQRRESSEAFE
ncbi:MAG TPA: GatB/YqeY domain-containing protein, partial [Ardenticatenaceae bacterium]